MNNNGEVFSFNQHELTVITDDNSNPWFVAVEVCSILNIDNSRQAVSGLDDDEKGVISNDTLGGAQKMTIISESGLYSLIIKSRKKETARFRKWITSDVLPKIRKTGKYEIKERTEIERLADAVLLANRVLSEARPKIEFYDKVAISENTHLVREVAKILKLPYGQNKLYSKMKELKILMSNREPYQQYVDAGYFEVLLREYDNCGKTLTSKTTVVTGKGIEWLSGKLKAAI